MRYLYTILLYLATPFLVIRFYLKGRRNPGYRARLAERFGFVPSLNGARSLWVHTVSLGESIAASPLLNALLNEYPQYRLVVTTTTPTGYHHLQQRFGSRIQLSYAPLDLPDVLARFWRRTHPQLLVLFETELWPNLITLAAARAPILLANARLSPRSFQRYYQWRRWLAPLLSRLSHVAAQSAAEVTRFHALGVAQDQITLTGNLKFDLAPTDTALQQGRALRASLGNRPTWIAASTHPGEEAAVLEALQHIHARHPNVLLILVPRHPERFDEVAALIQRQGLTYARRSRGELPSANCAVYLADTLGELMLLYAASDIAWVGGSFAPIGGHNLIEPASVGLPILSGPALHNFAAIAELLHDQRALQLVSDSAALADAVMHLFEHNEERLMMGARALSVAEQNRGALEQHLRLIQALLSTN